MIGANTSRRRRVPDRASRSGKSLIEMLVVISITGALFGVVSLTLSFLLRLQANLEDAALFSRTVSRLSREFRRDVHGVRAEGVLIAEPKPDRGPSEKVPLAGFTFSLERAVAYEFDNGDVVRAEVSAGKTRRERYTLPRGSRCEIRRVDAMAGEAVEGTTPQGLEFVLRVPPAALTRSGRAVDSRTISESAWRVHHIVAETGRHP